MFKKEKIQTRFDLILIISLIKATEIIHFFQILCDFDFSPPYSHFSLILFFSTMFNFFHFCSAPPVTGSSTPAAVGGGTTTGTDGAFFMYWKYAPIRRPIMATIIRWYILYPSDFAMDAPLPPLLTA